VEDGLPSNVVNDIVQTRDGFLMVGTARGLVRFDGRHFASVHLSPDPTRDLIVQSLAESLNGDLWVGTRFGVSRIPAAVVHRFGTLPATNYHLGRAAGDSVACLRVARNGTVWAGTGDGLYRFDGHSFTQVVPLQQISRIEEDSNGHLLITSPLGLLEWDGTHAVPRTELFSKLGVRGSEVFHVLQDHHGTTWVCTSSGVFRQTVDSLRRLEGIAGNGHRGAFRAYEDRDGVLWFSMATGVFRAEADVLEPLAPGMDARVFYADDDGNLWTGTNGAGLIRFKNRTVQVFTKADGLPNDLVMTVLATHDGKIWAGNNCGGLSWFDGRHFHTLDERHGLSNSCVFALAEDHAGDLWVGSSGGGLFRFHEGRFTQYTTAQGLASNTVLGILVTRDGSIWCATPRGLSRLVERGFRTYTTADGLSADSIGNVYQDRTGAIWAATADGIDRLAGDRFVEVLPSEDRRSMRVLGEDARGALYVVLARMGVARLEGGRVGPIAAIDGSQMVGSRGSIWFAGGNGGIAHVTAGSLERWGSTGEEPLDYFSIGRADGLQSQEGSGGYPNLTIDANGRLWAATLQGLAMIDLPQMPRAVGKPLTYVGEITVDGKTPLSGDELMLSPGMHHVEVNFDSIELSSPERTRLQYKLDDVDPAWYDAGTIHTAIYRGVPAGVHYFHVRASNRDGVWDRDGIVYKITQQPFFYDTGTFRVAAFAFGMALLAALYRLRLRQSTARMNARLEERLAERERIARELHDTLLQGFQGLILHFQVAAGRIPHSEPARQMMETALDRADQVMAEGRDRVKGLRSPPPSSGGLAKCFVSTGEEIARGAMEISVVMEGDARNLHPGIQEEIYWIGREVLINAVRHSKGNRIEVEIAYGPSELRVRFRDDGMGIAAEILNGGRPGHFGLSGMRERAEKMGARISIGSRAGAGTEIELRVPARLAYCGSSGRSFWSWLRRVAIGGR
jgi:signal transduction histidine kinase/ligand-binding sensor domain-containing protein